MKLFIRPICVRDSSGFAEITNDISHKGKGRWADILRHLYPNERMADGFSATSSDISCFFIAKLTLLRNPLINSEHPVLKLCWLHIISSTLASVHLRYQTHLRWLAIDEDDYPMLCKVSIFAYSHSLIVFVIE
ncbi:hypothetical protein CEXT_370301 [Caerostris extrusa]|uniref:Uncharacterized protein n=1 Tax=Caerostris extrusa TaxID=172846 RepID=A0AAV4NG86_CAEEX|nr:hypothetical protein CEXT_370301 [Caerostris extrusa]